MSQFANFDQPAKPNPFAAPPPGGQGPKKSRAWLWILLGAGGMGLLVCCGCAGFGWYAIGLGFTEMEKDVQNRFSNDPVVLEHVGTIESVKGDFKASINTSQERGGDQVFVFHVVGSKGKGDIIGNKPKQGGISIRNPKLVLPDGQEFDLAN